ncbi:MAG: C40 family peptidase [Candidatus Eremiobacteraeota bacterium]|nr:C40 family peptidase [Candidatus Eremiobacteraeota bacterium]
MCFAAIAVPAAADSTTYTVVGGDTLSTIADRFNASLSAIETRNHLTDTTVLQLGQHVIIPLPPRAKPAAIAHHPKPARHTAAQRAANPDAIANYTGSVARIVAANALWAATHAGSAPPVLPGGESFELAERALGLDARITHTAMRYLGVPYMWGGTSFAGVDCSGFVQTVFAKNGIELPRMADEQFAMGHRIAERLLMPGDLVFFETYTSGASHVGIYIGHGKFIHASMRGVMIDSLGMDYYAARYIGARRFVQ